MIQIQAFVSWLLGQIATLRAKMGRIDPSSSAGSGKALRPSSYRDQNPGAGRKGIDWLGLDSMIDAGLSETWERIKDRYSAASSWFARMRLSGVQRLMNELVSEAFTMCVGGLVVMYALALPAMLEVDEANLLSPGKYSVKFVDKDGIEIGRRGINLDDAVKLEDIPDHLIKATLATEDRRFFEHFGVDFVGTLRALSANLQKNDVVQGGSTLTQQLAKNLFLSSERSIQRKIKEVFLSFWLESRLTKKQILKLYFDRAYMGGGAFGVEAAAKFYFGKHVRDVTLAEAAMMAGLFKAPTKYAPHVNLPAARARANDVLSNLVEAGFYTEGQVHDARLHPAKPVDARATESPDWFLDWAYEEIQRVMDGKGQYVLTSRTTIDMGLQRQAEQALSSTIRQFGNSHHVKAGALVSMSPDGAVRALVGGLDYGESQFNRATHAHRQPGSSFKLYVYTAAMENGFNPHSSVRDSAPTCGNWSPKNYNGGSGSGNSIQIIDAFKQSLNTTAVFLSLNVGREKVIEITERLGIQGVKKTCSMALGDGGLTPLEHTGAYSTFANGGKLTKPYALLDIVNGRGDLLYSRDRDEPEAEQVFSKKVVEEMNQLMQAVVLEGTGRKAQLDFTNVVGKTGTSSSYRDAWFMGFTGKLATGVWLGNDDFRPMLISSSAGEAAHGVTGGGLPAITWQAFMSGAHPSMDIPPIMGIPVHPKQIEERERIAALKRSDPNGLDPTTPAGSRRYGLMMPEPARETLRKLAQDLRKASGREGLDAVVAPGNPAAPGVPALPVPGLPGKEPQKPTAAPPADRRAEINGPSSLPLTGGRR